MIPFLLTLSFILHLITLLIIVLQSIRIRKLSENEYTNKAFKRELEETLSSYLLEMKEENERFLQDFSTRKPAQRSPNLKKASTVYESVPHAKDQGVSEDEKPTNNSDETLPPLPEGSDTYVQSFEAQVLSLHDQGLSVDEIAQRLNKGKTEVDLLLKFRQERS